MNAVQSVTPLLGGSGVKASDLAAGDVQRWCLWAGHGMLRELQSCLQDAREWAFRPVPDLSEPVPIQAALHAAEAVHVWAIQAEKAFPQETLETEDALRSIAAADALATMLRLSLPGLARHVDRGSRPFGFDWWRSHAYECELDLTTAIDGLEGCGQVSLGIGRDVHHGEGGAA